MWFQNLPPDTCQMPASQTPVRRQPDTSQTQQLEIRRQAQHFKIRQQSYNQGQPAPTEKKVEPKWLHPWSRFMVHNSVPPMALFWCHLQRWSCFRQIWPALIGIGHWLKESWSSKYTSIRYLNNATSGKYLYLPQLPADVRNHGIIFICKPLVVGDF